METKNHKNKMGTLKKTNKRLMKTDTKHTEHGKQFRKTYQNHMNNYNET